MRITNKSAAPQGVHTVSGVAFIKPGQSRDLELTDAGLKQAKRLSFLAFADAPHPLDHDADGKPGGAAPNDPPSERDDLKKQAAELGIEFPKNIATDKLRALIDAKLAA